MFSLSTYFFSCHFFFFIHFSHSEYLYNLFCSLPEFTGKSPLRYSETSDIFCLIFLVLSGAVLKILLLASLFKKLKELTKNLDCYHILKSDMCLCSSVIALGNSSTVTPSIWCAIVSYLCCTHSGSWPCNLC